jgi:hypothetical protein
MRPTERRQRNERGEFAPVDQNQVATVENQVAENTDEQIQAVSSVENKTQFGTLVTLKRWKIAVTPDRAQVFLWSALVVTQFLSMAAIISFWLCALMCLKTLPTWNGLIAVFNGLVRRNAPQANPGPAAYPPEDNMWTDLFPPADVINSYNLRLGLTQTGHPNADVVFAYGTPIMLGHPFIWMGGMFLTFCSYHFLSFILGCIRRAHRVTNFRRRLT